MRGKGGRVFEVGMDGRVGSKNGNDDDDDDDVYPTTQTPASTSTQRSPPNVVSPLLITSPYTYWIGTAHNNHFHPR